MEAKTTSGSKIGKMKKDLKKLLKEVGESQKRFEAEKDARDKTLAMEERKLKALREKVFILRNRLETEKAARDGTLVVESEGWYIKKKNPILDFAKENISRYCDEEFLDSLFSGLDDYQTNKDIPLCILDVKRLIVSVAPWPEFICPVLPSSSSAGARGVSWLLGYSNEFIIDSVALELMELLHNPDYGRIFNKETRSLVIKAYKVDTEAQDSESE